MPAKKPDPFSLLLEGIADYSVFLLNTEGQIKRWSTSAQKMFGYADEHIQGKHFSCLYPQTHETSDAANIQEELEMAAAHGRFEDTGWRVRQDHSQFWADCVICPIRDERGDPHGFSVIIRDITERKKAEEALRLKEDELSQARKMEAVGRLAGGIAHDFNNFITGIVGLAEEVRASMGDSDPRRDDLDEIIKTADQARTLTRQLLAYGRRQTSSPQVMNLNSVIMEKQKILARLLGADVQLDIVLDPAVRQILMDPTQFDQILINLVMNARDAIEQGGVIRIQTERLESGRGDSNGLAGPQIALRISDNGSGIDPAVLAHIFEPFFTTKEQGKGTGLGLSTVYGIIKQNHGDISVKSQIDKGTTFEIMFPEIDTPVLIEPALPAEPLTAGSETILVVEDTDIVRRIVTQSLSKSGYKVLAASSGQEALTLCKEHRGDIHLMLTDMVMPGLNGLQLTDELRKTHPDAAILYMSAYAEDVAYKRGLIPSDLPFIQKPFKNDSLLRKVREVLDAVRETASKTS